MKVYKSIVRLKGNHVKLTLSLTAKNITDLKRRLNNMNYELLEIVDET